MGKIYRDDFFHLNQYDLGQNGDIFQTILDIRKEEVDSKRFFLNYIPQEVIDRYDFNDEKSLQKFRNTCFKCDSPLQRMGGCNLQPDYLIEGIRYSGIKMSDPSGKIYGSFDINNGVITYSPIFPHFYEERDLIKFANDKYFTTMTFEDIMFQQIELAKEFYVHTGDYTNLKEVAKKGKYIFEKINKNQMIEFVSKSESGEKIYRKYLRLK